MARRKLGAQEIAIALGRHLRSRGRCANWDWSREKWPGTPQRRKPDERENRVEPRAGCHDEPSIKIRRLWTTIYQLRCYLTRVGMTRKGTEPMSTSSLSLRPFSRVALQHRCWRRPWSPNLAIARSFIRMCSARTKAPAIPTPIRTGVATEAAGPQVRCQTRPSALCGSGHPSTGRNSEARRAPPRRSAPIGSALPGSPKL
jgi:hypothetical protein